MAEAFQPIAVKPPAQNRLFFTLRCLGDLQLLTIVQFLRPLISSWQGRVLDVGAGEAPWCDFMPNADYYGVDVASASEFGMTKNARITYYDGRTLPFGDDHFDHVLSVEVMEHVADPVSFLSELRRVLRPGGSLALTVPWSARLHHVPHDYHRFTRYRLEEMLKAAGFDDVLVAERGNDIAAIANKLLVLTIRLIKPARKSDVLWTFPLAVILALPTSMFLLAAHVALLLGMGAKEDPLGYGVMAQKR